MSETTSHNQQIEASHIATSKSAKTSRKSSVVKSEMKDWQAIIRQSVGTSITILGEFLIQAGKDLTQPKTVITAKKRRSQTATQH